MIHPQHTLPGLAFSSLAVLVGCQSSTHDGDEVALDIEAPAETPVEIPADVDDQYDTVLEYLIERYDTDDDGRVAEAEYGREGGRFERLDRNHDGYVDRDDYAPRGGGQDRGAMRARMGAQMVVFHYFDDDGDIEVVSKQEVLASFASYDANADGSLVRLEFEAKAEQKLTATDEERGMMSMMLGDDGPWPPLAAGVDADKSGALSSAELVAFFDELDDGDGVWSRGGRRGRGSAPASAAAPAPKRGAAEGEVAPDFTLSSPHGGDPVTLSSFAGKQPVALIFGSYT